MKKPMKETGTDKFFVIANTMLIGLVVVTMLYPLWLVFISSFSDPDLVARGQVWLYPEGFTFDAYQSVFEDQKLLTGYRNTIFYTLGGTLVNLLLTLPAAYALSKQHLKGRSIFLLAFTFTMYFSGGMIPSFLNIRNLGLLNTWTVLLLVSGVNTFNLILARTFFQAIPDELEEAAMIDGASILQRFLQIVLPVSKALLGVITLYYMVAHWNSFYTALLYLSGAPEKHPLQLYLRDVLVNNLKMAELMGESSEEMALYYANLANQIKYAVIVVSALPMLILYPYFQKFFEKGVMLGSVKG